MKFPIRDAFHRHRLDRAYLNKMKPEMIGCPKCGRVDSLNYAIQTECNLEIDCKYHIKCDACGYEPTEWYDSIADAVLVFDMEARHKADVI